MNGITIRPSSFFTKIISLLLIPTFVLSSIAYSAPQGAVSPVNSSVQEVITNPDNIVIPREFGLVKSKYNSNNDKLVVHVQDAHCNYEAQTNIAKIVETLVKNDNLALVSVEGADGFIDTTWFKAFPDAEVRKEVADYFMKKGEITGPEFLSITTDLPFKLYGAETREYYIENLNAFTSSYPLKADTEKYLNTIKAALNKLKGYIYNSDLKLMDEKKAAYDSKELEFNEYVRFLQSEAEKNKINLRAYENFFKLVNVLIYEDKIDFKVTDKERSTLIDDLSKILSKDAITELVNKSVSFKVGKISSTDYYSYLRNLAITNGIDMMTDYKNLYNYIIYNSVYSKIENEELFNDITAVETAIKEKLFQNDDQRDLERLSRHINTLLGLVNIKLLNGEYDYYKTHKEEFTNEVFTSFITKKGAQFGLAIFIDPPADSIADSISKLDDFYAIAIRRDKALVDNTLKTMDKEGQKLAVLVTGGFHSEGITKLLEKQGVSYMVVCPTITKDVPTRYIEVLTNQRTSFDDIVMGVGEAPVKQGMLAPASLPWLADLTQDEVAQITGGMSRKDKAHEVWLRLHFNRWLTNAHSVIQEHTMARDEGLFWDAYLRALTHRLGVMVEKDIIAREDLEKIYQDILADKDFRAAFSNAYASVTGGVAADQVASVESPDGYDGRGAFRIFDKGLTSIEHATYNRVVGKLLDNDLLFREEAYSLIAQTDPVTGERVLLPGNIALPLANDEDLSPNEYELREKLIRNLLTDEQVTINIVPRLSNGLEAEAIRGLIAQYHTQSKTVDIDEDFYTFLLSLTHDDCVLIARLNAAGLFSGTSVNSENISDGVTIIFKILMHDIMHISNPIQPGETLENYESRIERLIEQRNPNYVITDEEKIILRAYYTAIRSQAFESKDAFEASIPAQIMSRLARIKKRGDDVDKSAIGVENAYPNSLIPGAIFYLDDFKKKVPQAWEYERQATEMVLNGGLVNQLLFAGAATRARAILGGGAKYFFNGYNLTQGMDLSALERKLNDLGVTNPDLLSDLRVYARANKYDVDAVIKNEGPGLMAAGLSKDKLPEIAEAAVVYALTADMRAIPEFAEIDDIELGAREILQYRLELERLARNYAAENNKDAEEVIENAVKKAKFIVHVNDISKDEVIESFKKWNFFGFDRDNIIFVVQDTFAGYLPTATGLKPDNRLDETGNVKKRPFGHGYTLMQSAVGKGMGNVVGQDGRMKSIGNISPLEYLKDRGAVMMANTNVEDWTKIQPVKPVVENGKVTGWEEMPSAAIDILRIAQARYLMANGAGVVIEGVKNLKGQKGGSWLKDIATHNEALIEGLALQDHIAVKNRRTGQLMLIRKRTFNEERYEKLSPDQEKAFWIEQVLMNKMANYYDIEALLKYLPEYALPNYLDARSGALYLESVTGDVTQIPDMHAAAFSKRGEVILSFKKVEDVEGTMRCMLAQDRDPEFKAMVARIRPEAASPVGVGAIRLGGGVVTDLEHGTRGVTAMDVRLEASVNGVIGAIIYDNHQKGGRGVYALKESRADQYDEDLPISLGVPELATLNDAQHRNLNDLMSAFNKVEMNFVILKGLKDRLRKRKVAPDLVFHPGMGRKAVYMDEGDLLYLLSLENGADLVMEAVNHELEHIRNPQLPNETGAEYEVRIENMAPTHNVRLALLDRDTTLAENMVASAATAQDRAAAVAGLLSLSKSMNYYSDYLAVEFGQELKSRFDSLLVRKSIIARNLAGMLIENQDNELLESVGKEADAMMAVFLKGQIEKGKTKPAKAEETLETTRKYLNEWLNPASNIPGYMVHGIYRAMLEGRSADLLYSFGAGWREFGTAGIRNPALQSSFDAVQNFELKEFAADKFAPVLTGPNLINAVTLLQQEASVGAIMKDLQAKIKAGDPSLSQFDERFLEGVKNNRVEIAYDSRINGSYFADLLAAAFLKDGIQVDLFDNAAGVPHLAWAANREGAAFGFLISASHSEANYNGFKAFLGYQMSQVDKLSKEMIVGARDNVGYDTMSLGLALPGADLSAVLRDTVVKDGTGKNVPGLRWIGDDKPIQGKDYLGKELVSFYPWYYNLVKERSPLKLLPEEIQNIIAEEKSSNPLKVLYTAFFGAGAVPAANFPKFLAETNYSAVDTVKAQTDVMDGMFPGHKSPDPGIVQGWISNFIDYIEQYAGDDYSDIGSAIAAFNEQEVGVATDPDIDRAGMMIGLPEGVRGNIKAPLIEAVKARIMESDKIDLDSAAREALAESIASAMQANLADKMLMTANDAWTFMMYWKLKMMEEAGKLEKDRVYIIEKSHVTTSALERVAELYQDKGYHVYVIDTYVGFTEIGKKGRDLFNIAKHSWDAYQALDTGADLSAIIQKLEEADRELRTDVPYKTAGLPIVTETIGLLKQASNGDLSSVGTLKQNLDALSRMHILSGVEESNGYGELGRWNRYEETVELNHISDKDGSLAAFGFLEILSYGRSLSRITDGEQPDKSAYEMYQDLTKDIGMVCTVNSALYHPGLTGVEEKLNEIEGLEKIFAYILQKRIDAGQIVKLFNGKYTVNKVEVYRAEKYDNNFLGFAEEGIRLYVTTQSGGEGIITYRPSGTGDSNRDYNWLLGIKPAPDADFEDYRDAIESEMETVVKDFFGIEGQETGYADLPAAGFHGLLTALKEGGLNRQFEILGKAMGEGPVALTDAEQSLLTAVSAYAVAAKKGATDEAKIRQARIANRRAWGEYLASPEAQPNVVSSADEGGVSIRPEAFMAGRQEDLFESPQNVTFELTVNGQVAAQIPQAAMIAWQAGLVDYLIGLIQAAGPNASFSFPDQEITDLINKRMPNTPIIGDDVPPPAAPDGGNRGDSTPPNVGDQWPADMQDQGDVLLRDRPETGVRQMTEREQFIHEEYIKDDEASLRSLLVSLKVTPAMIAGKNPVLLLDDNIIDRRAAQFADKAINRYAVGDSNVFVVRGSGAELLERLEALAQEEGIDLSDPSRSGHTVVTGVSTATLNAIGQANYARLGRILNIDVNPEDNEFLSPIALVDVMLRIGYSMPETDILRRINEVFSAMNGGTISVSDLRSLMDMTNRILRLRPIDRIDPNDIDEANRAAAQALRSL